MSVLVMCNKLLENSVAKNNKHSVSDSFCESAVREPLSWVVLTEALSWVSLRLPTRRTVVFSRPDGNRKVHFQDGTFRGCRQEADTTWAFPEPAWVFTANRLPSEQVIQEKRNRAAFSNLVSEVTLGHFHFYPLRLRSKSLKLDHIKGRGVRFQHLKEVSKNFWTHLKALEWAKL